MLSAEQGRDATVHTAPCTVHCALCTVHGAPAPVRSAVLDSRMRILVILALGLQTAAQPSPKTMSALMIDPIYPASDAIFYISTRTPATDADWRALETKAAALAGAANALVTP